MSKFNSIVNKNANDVLSKKVSTFYHKQNKTCRVLSLIKKHSWMGHRYTEDNQRTREISI